MYNFNKKIGRPAGLLILLMIVVGFVINKFSGEGIDWVAYLIMMGFYLAMFIVGAYAATRSSNGDAEGD